MFTVRDLVVGVWWACWWFWVAHIALNSDNLHTAKFGCRLFKDGDEFRLTGRMMLVTAGPDGERVVDL